jgi:hypothetical protein
VSRPVKLHYSIFEERKISLVSRLEETGKQSWKTKRKKVGKEGKGRKEERKEKII